MNRNAAFCGVRKWSLSGSRIGALVMERHLHLAGIGCLTVVIITVSGRHLVPVIRADGACVPRKPVAGETRWLLWRASANHRGSVTTFHLPGGEARSGPVPRFH